MMKRLLALLAMACIMLPSAALADVWEGVTAASDVIRIEAPSSGILEKLNLRVGQTVSADETLGSIRANRVYASDDGVVARISAHEGEKMNGTVMEIDRVSPYTVYCTVERSYVTAANRMLHNGQTLYLRCTSNGTHRGVGFAYNVTAGEFTMEITAGAFYTGETVYVYTSPDCEQKTRVGIGTVVGSQAAAYSTSGNVLQLRVAEGQYIQRGKLLYTWADGESLTIISPAAGVITAVSAAQGDAARKDGAVAEMAAFGDICLELQVPAAQLERLPVGRRVTYTRAADRMETPCTGVVAYVSAMPEGETYTVRITPDVAETMLGMSVEVWD